jgi:molybdate transport system substrate-binding protein
MRKLTVCTALTVGVLCTSATAARAAEIRVLASTGIQVAVEALKPQFEKATGDTLSVDFSTTATLRDRIEKGEAFDVAILTDDAIDALIKSGALDASTRAELARVGIGVAYRKGAPAPKVKTAGDLKQALVNAKSVAYTGNGATRPAIEKMFDAMGPRPRPPRSRRANRIWSSRSSASSSPNLESSPPACCRPSTRASSRSPPRRVRRARTRRAPRH